METEVLLLLFSCFTLSGRDTCLRGCFTLRCFHSFITIQTFWRALAFRTTTKNTPNSCKPVKCSTIEESLNLLTTTTAKGGQLRVYPSWLSLQLLALALQVFNTVQPP